METILSHYYHDGHANVGLLVLMEASGDYWFQTIGRLRSEDWRTIGPNSGRDGWESMFNGGIIRPEETEGARTITENWKYPLGEMYKKPEEFEVFVRDRSKDVQRTFADMDGPPKQKKPKFGVLADEQQQVGEPVFHRVKDITSARQCDGTCKVEVILGEEISGPRYRPWTPIDQTSITIWPKKEERC